MDNSSSNSDHELERKYSNKTAMFRSSSSRRKHKKDKHKRKKHKRGKSKERYASSERHYPEKRTKLHDQIHSDDDVSSHKRHRPNQESHSHRHRQDYHYEYDSIATRTTSSHDDSYDDHEHKYREEDSTRYSKQHRPNHKHNKSQRHSNDYDRNYDYRSRSHDRHSDGKGDDREHEKELRKNYCRDNEKKDKDSKKKCKEDTGPDYEFDWEGHKSVLNRIFFNEDDMIKRGSQEYHDFWGFLQKYVAFKRKKALKEPLDTENKSNSNIESSYGLPSHYDKRYRINLEFQQRECATYLSERGPHASLTKGRVAQFHQIFLHYLDFNQKQKFAKLVKIRKDQENLPIYQYKEEIIEAVKTYQAVVVAGDTGCGKSTQVPQYLLEAGFEHVACTQPRRIACISLSKRVAYETLNEYASQVAYQVRFEKTKTAATKILFLTEGLLLRQIQSDPNLSMYSVIVIDEVHERHITTDFLLGVLKCLLKQRPDLKLVLMSATINLGLFSSYFDDAPVVKVPGRLYPIELTYVPISREDAADRTQRLNPAPYIRILQRINHKYPDTERGDVLMFLSGLNEIMAVVEAAKIYASESQKWIILPLHSAMSVTDQDKVFDFPPEGVRKCIVSTNIAETSVTIDGIRFVVDSGKVKEKSFDSNSNLNKLQEFWISKASAEQRKGRAGRTGPGVCFRLYDEGEYNELDDYSTPEIQRVPLDTLILQMVSMGLENIRLFPFLEEPSSQNLENSIAFLKEQGALTEDEKLTAMGEMLSQLPVEVIIGKMLIMGSLFHMIDPVLCLSAILSVQSPFTAKAHTDHDAMSARKNLESDHGDPFTLLNAYDEWIQIKAEGRGSRNWCKRRCLEEQRFYEATKLKNQFREVMQQNGLLEKEEETLQNLTSMERQQKHADRKRLRKLKQEQLTNSRKRKMLKLEDDDYEVEMADANPDEDGDDKDTESSIKDLEFRLTHDLNKVQEQSNKRRSFTLKDINLLKVILCSGLYPQVAIADEFNSTLKSNAEPMYHTKTKGFITLHPTSVFASNPELLEVQMTNDEDARSKADTKTFMSSKHQLLTYVTLLETTKPFLMGPMRVPALQTCVLYANFIDTNSDCTRLLIDGWLELKLNDPEDAEHLLTSVVQLRSTCDKLIQAKLQDKIKHVENSTTPYRFSIYKLQKLLSRKLAEFLDSNTVYSIRRVLPAELQQIYVGPQEGKDDFAGMFKSGEAHPVKGGIRVNTYLTYNCLHNDELSSVYGGYTVCMQKHWTCPHCQESMVVTLVDRIQHEQQCETLTKNAEKSEKDHKRSGSTSASVSGVAKKTFDCPVCNMTLHLSSVEILKHKKMCKENVNE